MVLVTFAGAVAAAVVPRLAVGGGARVVVSLALRVAALLATAGIEASGPDRAESAGAVDRGATEVGVEVATAADVPVDMAAWLETLRVLLLGVNCSAWLRD